MQCNVFIKSGWEIEMWSLAPWYVKGHKLPQNCLKGKFIYNIKSKEDFLDNVRRIKNEKCIIQFDPYHAYNSKVYACVKILSNYGIPYIFATEHPVFWNNFRGVRTQRLCALGIELKNVLYIICKFIRSILKPSEKNKHSLETDWVRFWGPIRYRSMANFISTNEAYRYIPNKMEIFSSRNILIHSASYDEYLLSKNKDTIIKEPYCVYIDQGFLDEKFGLTVGNSPWIKHDFKKHQYDICQLFDTIEEMYACKVVVAAHPKSNYIGGEYGGREIIYNVTNQLVKDSQLVITHFSTTINLAVTYNKSILILTFDDLLASRKDIEYYFYTPFCKAMKCFPLNISHNYSIEDIRKCMCMYEKKKYDVYRKQYVNSNKIDTDNLYYEDVIEFLRSKIE